MKAPRHLMLALAILTLLGAAHSCTRQKEGVFRKTSIIMDTFVGITVVSSSEREAEAAIEEAFDEIRRLEGLLSCWTDKSEIALVNKNAGMGPVKVSPDTLDIIEKALFISGKTHGAFDPTIGPVMRLWDFRTRKLPDRKALDRSLPLVNYRMMETDGENSTAFLKKKGMSFETGGIAKGYAADKAVEILKKRGITSGLVAVAGDIRAFGERPDGNPWRVGIRNPRADGKDDDLMATIELHDEAVSTSGDYERFFVAGGKRYHHILDPNTGLPVEGLISVSIITGEAVLTDGFSTGVFVMGAEKGMELLNELGLEGIIIDSEGRRRLTKGMRDRIQWKD